ncbi:hypothetical protein INT47_001676 [Mucor saturninus]|uniref:Uncharacterized protein n=1 Tax=Mucor saturninus TaxID=64648 RepID=A0A8H7V6U4_9FUNG|nr:hypothetical protein INT47_001676 [Mucor saturninus]
MPPNEKNRRKAKKIISKSSFDVTFLKNADPMIPVAIGKVTKQLNPFLYCSYPETPPFSDEETDILDISSEEYDDDDDASVIIKPKKNFKKKSIEISKEIFLLNNPQSPHYDYMFLTSDVQYAIIKEHFDVENLSQRAYASLLSKSDIISYTTTWKGAKGRWVYVMKKQYRGIFDQYH